MRYPSSSFLGAVIGGSIVCFACAPGNSRSRLDGENAGGGQGGLGGTFNPSQSGGADSCEPGPDGDKDGFYEPIDCNDCDPNVNPGAVEVPTDPEDPDAGAADENCNGEIDEPLAPCDAGLFYADASPYSAAKAIELCTEATPDARDYGLLEASWVHADGSPTNVLNALNFGIQQHFGPNVPAQRGDNMLMLSSGFARLPGQQGAADNHLESTYAGPSLPPPNFPANVPGCQGAPNIYDDIGLEVLLRAPTNATGFKFRFKFHSFEFAEYVCTSYNDQFIAWVSPPPVGSIDGNISFDSNGNPVSVNIAFFDVCDPVVNSDFAFHCGGGSGCPAMPSPYCPSGPSELLGSGFDDCFGSNFEDAGATSWLQTTSPIEGGEEFTIRFAIWDTGDEIYDSTVLVDAFEWTATPGTVVGTEPPPR